MATKESGKAATHESRLPFALDLYGRVMSGLLMLLGLFQWAVILGVVPGAGRMFEEMVTPWKMATINLAVVYLVASVGLWQRAAWGNVLWIYVALFEVAMHTVFISTYGSDVLIVAFHVVTVGGFLVLSFLARRVAAK
ncbi:MAG: hypothetical protein KDK07_21755 [Bauldia sp.]|nr:hypothetical protein [Bauldia sp.]